MKSANEVFTEFISEPINREWYNTRPEAVQRLIRKMPWETFIVKEGAPYGVSCPGQKVHLHCYIECRNCGKAYMKVVVLGKEKIAAAKEHEKLLYEINELSLTALLLSMREINSKTLEEIHAADIIVAVDPKWLEPFDEVYGQ